MPHSVSESSPVAVVGTGPNKDIASSKQPIRALPSSWYTSPEFYNFERRAIFSRRWLLMTHKSRLQQPGDFLRYKFAGFDVVINLDRKGNVKAFHNSCRHRAYTVVEKESGKASIFACRYHGWSYGLDGKLAKAPSYQELEGFDKSQNGLFPVHVRLDINGFIYINLDSKETPEVSWEEHFQDVDKQERYDRFDFDNYVLDYTYTLEGEYNWKILSDNFNECYHCKTTHPDVPTFLTIDSHHADCKDGHMQHDHASTPEQKKKGYDVNSTYYFPNASTSISPHFLMIQKFMPTGPTTCVMHYEVYRNKTSSDEDFHVIADMYARVMSEDKALCEGAQQNLNAGVFINGALHPRWEHAPLFFQETVRELVTEHHKRERMAGEEIWPARPKMPVGAGADISQSDVDLCNEIECGIGKKKYEW